MTYAEETIEHAPSPSIPRAWLLNLDSELELRRPSRYQPTKASLNACQHFEPWARGLVAPDDLVVSRVTPIKGIARGYRGVAWCPTPSALTALEYSGATLAPAPSLACLQQVSHRRFHAGLGQLLPHAQFAADLEQARSVLERPQPMGWLVKRGFGFAGRSNRRFPTSPTPDDWRWLDHAFHDGGVQIEPWLELLAEFSLHGHIAETGVNTFGEPCVRLSLDVPVYERATSAVLQTPERAALFAQAERVSRALFTAGYRGPFGIDAFRYQSPLGPCFNPRSEINARHTLAYATGMGPTQD
jgi:hypothetical protein